MVQEWPKWVNGRIARNPTEAQGMLSHTQDCGIHTSLVVGEGLFRPRHPDHVLECNCGGVTPSPEQLQEAGVIVKPGLTPEQVAALDRAPDDGVIKPGGAPKGGNRKKRRA